MSFLKKISKFFLTYLLLNIGFNKFFTKLYKSSDDYNSCWLFAISVFPKSQFSCSCLCIIDCTADFQKEKKEFFCDIQSLQNAACILASSDPLFHDLAFSIFFWNLQAEGKGGGHPPLHLKFFKLKRGLLMNSPFANGKVDSVELIIRFFPIFTVNFVFYS